MQSSAASLCPGRSVGDVLVTDPRVRAISFAQIARDDAAAIQERARLEEEDHRQRINATIGAARAAQAGNGFLVDNETNEALLIDLFVAGETDILRFRDDVALRGRLHPCHRPT